MREQSVRIVLAGVALPDVATGASVDLGDRPGVRVVSLIRHRY